MGTDDREASTTVPPVRPRCKCHGEPMYKDGFENRTNHRGFGQQKWKCRFTHAKYEATEGGRARRRRLRDLQTRQRREASIVQRRADLDIYYRGGL